MVALYGAIGWWRFMVLWGGGARGCYRVVAPWGGIGWWR